MEILIILGIIVVLVLVFGGSFLPLISLILWIFLGMSLLCVLFFAIMAAAILLGKKKDAVLKGLERVEKFGDHAVYETEGKEYRNLFPTDGLMRTFFYRKDQVKIRLLMLQEKPVVFDGPSQLIVWIGLPAFAVLSMIFMSFL